MKVFLTGGTGAVGKAILASLLAHGHSVTCTVKDSTAREALLTAFPNQPLLTLVDIYLTPSSGPELVRLASDYDCIIHSVHNFSDDYHAMEEVCLRAFIEAGKAAVATGRPCQLISTTSTASIGRTEEEVDETGSTDNPSRLGIWRVPMERLVLDAAEGDFITAIVRPVWVYGGSWVDQYVNAVKTKRQAVAPAMEGNFGLIHRDDLANLYRIVMEKRASGIFHGTEPHYTTTSQVLSKVQVFCGDQPPIRTESPNDYVKDYGYFLWGMEGQQRAVPRRSLELGWSPRYNFLTSFEEIYGS
jgi:nucleoside-diphosphate-sugar epimerase